MMRGNTVKRYIIEVSSSIISTMGMAITKDQRSAKLAVNALGVISPDGTIPTVIIAVAIRIAESLPP